jgi:hypothetical protein
MNSVGNHAAGDVIDEFEAAARVGFDAHHGVRELAAAAGLFGELVAVLRFAVIVSRYSTVGWPMVATTPNSVSSDRRDFQMQFALPAMIVSLVRSLRRTRKGRILQRQLAQRLVELFLFLARLGVHLDADDRLGTRIVSNSSGSSIAHSVWPVCVFLGRSARRCHRGRLRRSRCGLWRGCAGCG